MITRHHIASADMRSMFLRLTEDELKYRNKNNERPIPEEEQMIGDQREFPSCLSDASQYSRFGTLMRESGNRRSRDGRMRNMKMNMTVNPVYWQKKARDVHPLGFPAPSK
jgi:hypothetical protein